MLKEPELVRVGPPEGICGVLGRSVSQADAAAGGGEKAGHDFGLFPTPLHPVPELAFIETSAAHPANLTFNFLSSARVV